MKNDSLARSLVPVALLLLLRQPTDVDAESCPHPEDIAPCSCRHRGTNSDITVTCEGADLAALEDAFHHLQEKMVDTMVLSKLRIARLPSALFWGLRVKNLVLEQCDLQGVADVDRKPAFLGLERSLQNLRISASIKGDNRLTTLNLAHLSILKQIILEDNNIPELGNDWFRKGPISLKEVDIRNCGIRLLGDRAFESLTNLWLLRLTYCPFNTFRRSMLPKPANNLDFIIFRRCNLHGLPSDALSAMPSLKRIWLDLNFIARLPSATWAAMWEKLDLVDLRKNPLECDSHMEWTFRMKRPPELHGNCVTPEARKNEALNELIDKNQHKKLFKMK